MNLTIILFSLLIILILCLCNNTYFNTIEGLNDNELYINLMNDFNKIFPDRNRNAGGLSFIIILFH